MSLQHSDVSICEFEAFKTLDCYTIHMYEVGVAVYKTHSFHKLEYNIEKAPADSIILQSRGLNLADIFYCGGLRAPYNNQTKCVCLLKISPDNSTVPKDMRGIIGPSSVAVVFNAVFFLFEYSWRFH